MVGWLGWSGLKSKYSFITVCMTRQDRNKLCQKWMSQSVIFLRHTLLNWDQIYVQSKKRSQHDVSAGHTVPWAMPLPLLLQWNLTIKTTYGTSRNGLNIEVVLILNHYFSRTKIYHDKISKIQYLKTYYLTKMTG